MIADFMTKPLQGALFKKFRDYIMGVRSVPTDQETKSLTPPEGMATGVCWEKRISDVLPFPTSKGNPVSDALPFPTSKATPVPDLKKVT